MIKSTILALTLALNIDYGGSLFDRMQAFEMLERTNVTIPLSGMCISACTMFLGLPKVCVEEDTLFGFHSASTYDGEKPKMSNFGNGIMMQYYPENIKRWVKEKKALESLDLTLMTAEEVWKLGIPKCEDKKNT